MIDKLMHEVNSNTIVVVDVGCRWGFAEKFLSSELAKRFYICGFDPDAEECNRLNKIYSDKGYENVECFPLALMEREGERDLHICAEPGCSSVYPPLKFLSDNYDELACIELKKKIKVFATTLSEWAKKRRIARIDYIKVDTQGSELDVLEGCGDLLKTISCIDVEVEFNPIYQGQHLFSDVDTFLRKHGFVLWKFSNLVHYSIRGAEVDNEASSVALYFDSIEKAKIKSAAGQLFWADATYVHRSVLEKNNNNEALTRNKVLFESLKYGDLISHLSKVNA